MVIKHINYFSTAYKTFSTVHVKYLKCPVTQDKIRYKPLFASILKGIYRIFLLGTQNKFL